MFISLIGTWIQMIAQSWLVFQLTNSAFLLGLVGFLTYIPIFILSLFGGTLADRMNKRNILITTQISFMILAFILAILTHLGKITPHQIMLIALLNGVVMAFDAPSRQAVVVELVGKTNLLNAIALNSAAFNSARIIGPALAGILIASIGMSGCFYINGISFLAVIIALLSIKLNNHVKKSERIDFRKGILDCLKYIKENPIILILISMVGVASLFGISYVILMPVLAENILRVGVSGLSVLMSAAGFGALVAALLLARLGEFKHKGKLLIFSSLLFSITLILLSLSRIYLLSIVILIILGWASVTAISLINTLLQTLVSDELRGRIMSVFMLVFAGAMPFGNLLSGSISHVFGVSVSIMINGIICIVFFTVIDFIYPELRKL